VAKLQAASVPIAQAAAPWDRQTDGQTNVGREQLNKEVDGKPVENTHAQMDGQPIDIMPPTPFTGRTEA